MAYTIRNAGIGNQAIADFSSTQNHPLGMHVMADDPTLGEGEFIYLGGVASTVVGSFVTYRADDWTTILLAADAAGPVAVAMSANIAATTFGWYQIAGKASGQAAASFADNGDVYITATAGVVDDAVVDGDMVHNCKGASTIVSAGLADFEIMYPYTDNITTND